MLFTCIQLRAILGFTFLRRAFRNLLVTGRCIVCRYVLKQPGDAKQGVAQTWGLENANQEIATADGVVAKHQRGINPATFNRFLHVLGKVANGTCAAWEFVQSLSEIRRKPCLIDTRIANDTV